MSLHYESVKSELAEILKELMGDSLFSHFRLVGGTNLSLRFNHRISTDIDMFTDAPYGSLDFNKLETRLKERFQCYECTDKSGIVGFGRTYYIGHESDKIVKLDLMYENEPFLHGEENNDGIRMADLEEMAVMKIDAIFRSGRKKDYWDLHFLLFDRGLELKNLIELHKKRFEYTHNFDELIIQLTNFSIVDKEPDPICKIGKSWDSIKMDLIEVVESL